MPLATTQRMRRRRQLVITIPLLSFEWLGHIRKRSLDYLLSGLLFIGGCGGVLYIALQPVFAPEATTPPEPVASAVVTPEPSGLARSIPTHLGIPDIQVSTDLIELGKNSDGTLETPTSYEIAGWYKYSPTPGEIGPAVIVGHVDSYQGPAVFFYLKDLQPGQLIHVSRQDGSTVRFQVDSVALFDQNNFPTDAVYGNIDHSGLRLITCGGVYNSLTGRYSHNTVVYASYVPDEP